jgi:hypothetical protein
MPPQEDDLLPIGVSAATGRPLPALEDDVVSAGLGGRPDASPEATSLADRAVSANTAFLIEGGVDASNLSQAGWGVLFAAGVDQKIKDAVQPLLQHRKAQGAEPFVVYDGATTYRSGDTASAWLDRHGVRLDVVDPAKGVPFYLLIVASPEAIPFSFQYSLDLYWAVGRLWFDTPDEFRRYAESVIAYENAAAVETTRQVAVFAPEHDVDAATQLFNRQVVEPLVTGEGNKPVPLGQRQKFAVQSFLSETASRATLDSIFAGQIAGGRPAVLFSGGHGMAFERTDPRQRATQGALVCQDWPGHGKVTESHWYAAADLPASAHVHGLVHFLFACHGGGCSSHDEFDRVNAQPKQIAEAPFIARLPQALLAHPSGGALAVLAHVERAWTYSFQSGNGRPQVQGFRDVLGRLLRGERIGQATDSFNLRWAVLSAALADLQIDKQHGADIPWKTLGRMWVARDDARNFIVLGDPAVRLRVDDMPMSG